MAPVCTKNFLNMQYMYSGVKFDCVPSGILVKQFILMNPEDVSENFGESHHCKNLKISVQC